MSIHCMGRIVLVLGVTTIAVSRVPAQSQWQYTALGDSLATGYLAQEGYVPRYDTYVQTDTGVSVLLVNLGQNGWTSGGLLNALRTNGTYQSGVSGATVLTWDIGTNDFKNARNAYKNGKCSGKDNQDCLRSAVSTFTSNWDAIVTEILDRRSTSNTIIRTIDLYYPWAAADLTSNTIPDSKETGPKGNDFQVLDYYLNEINAHIALSAANSGIPLAAVHTAFNGSNGDEDPVAKGYIASDGLHPSDTGHQVIATLLRGLAYAPLR
jgi:lysophospholipase L1-like esterase